MGRGRGLSILLLTAGALFAAVAALLVAAPVSAGNTWDTAAPVGTPIVDAQMHLNGSEEYWYVLSRTSGGVFNFSISSNSPLGYVLYAGDSAEGPMVVIQQAPSGTSGGLKASYSAPWGPRPLFYLRLNAGTAGVDFAMTLGIFLALPLSAGADVVFDQRGPYRWGGSDNNWSLVLKNSLLGGTDGLWNVEVTLVADNSNASQHTVRVSAVCFEPPLCSPTPLPEGYECDKVAGGCLNPAQESIHTAVWGSGSVKNFLVADGGNGLIFLHFHGSWGSFPGQYAFSDVTLRVRVTQSPLPAENLDDRLSGAQNVSDHRPLHGNLSQAGNLGDWFAFDSPGSPVPLNITMVLGPNCDLVGGVYTLCLVVEAFFFDSNFTLLGAANSEIMDAPYPCPECISGARAIRLVLDAGPAGQRTFLYFHVLRGAYYSEAPWATYNLTLELPNRAPAVISGNDTLSFDEETSAWFNLSAMFEDADGDPFTLNLSQRAGPFTLAWSRVGDQVLFESSYNQNGAVIFSAIANDSWPGGVTVADLTITVRPVNDPPIGQAAPLEVAWAQGESSGDLNISSAFFDVDGDLLNYSIQLPSELEAIWCGQGCVNIRAVSDNTYGRFLGTANATDPQGESAQVALDLLIIHMNRAPIALASAPSSLAMIAGSPATLLQASDFCMEPDFEPITFSLWTTEPTTHPFLGSHPTGTDHQLELAVLDPEAQGAWVVTLSCNDPSGARALVSINVTVARANLGPTLVEQVPGIGAITLYENTTQSFRVRFFDPEGGQLRLAWQLDGIDLQGAAFNGTTIAFDFGSAGSHIVTVTATDGEGLSAQARWVVSITNVDRPPTCAITAIDGVRGFAGETRNFTANSTDPDGDAITVAWWMDGVLIGVGPHLALALPNRTAALNLEVAAGPGSAACSILVFTIISPSGPRPDSNQTNGTGTPPAPLVSGGMEWAAPVGLVAAAAGVAALVILARRRR